MKLNLGCSTDIRSIGWTNVDIVPQPAGVPNYQQADLALPWPWEDSSIDEIYAEDIFEHIGACEHCGGQYCDRCKQLNHGNPRHWSGRIHVMNESWRILKPGGILTM